MATPRKFAPLDDEIRTGHALHREPPTLRALLQRQCPLPPPPRPPTLAELSKSLNLDESDAEKKKYENIIENYRAFIVECPSIFVTECNESLGYNLLEFEKALMELCVLHEKPIERVADAVRVLEGTAQAVSIDPVSAQSVVARDYSAAAKNLSWPTETYSEARERGVNIVQFLENHYAKLIKAGVATRASLAAHDPSAGKAVANFLYAGGKLPEELYLPTKKEVNDRLADKISDPGERPARLDWALRKRQHTRKLS